MCISCVSVHFLLPTPPQGTVDILIEVLCCLKHYRPIWSPTANKNYLTLSFFIVPETFV
uniref:Uncharacterized protein n=1 Tax=Anguilla anguilla TaxID=7936 RepID=A0A0E9STF3_ANGAN